MDPYFQAKHNANFSPLSYCRSIHETYTGLPKESRKGKSVSFKKAMQFRNEEKEVYKGTAKEIEYMMDQMKLADKIISLQRSEISKLRANADNSCSVGRKSVRIHPDEGSEQRTVSKGVLGGKREVQPPLLPDPRGPGSVDEREGRQGYVCRQERVGSTTGGVSVRTGGGGAMGSEDGEGDAGLRSERVRGRGDGEGGEVDGPEGSVHGEQE